MKQFHWFLPLILVTTLTWIDSGLAVAGEKSNTLGKTSFDHRNSLDDTGGPDGYGYRYVNNQNGDTAVYNWIELRGDPAAEWLPFGTDDDDFVLPFAVGFHFPFYGVAYDTVYVSTNGNLQFGTALDAYSNECLPTTAIDGPAIFAYWDDLDLSGGGYTSGGDITVGVRRFADRTVIEFDSVGHHGVEDTSFKFEVILRTDGSVGLQYNHMVFGDEINTQTIGIQSGGSGPALQYVCNAVGHQPLDWLAITFYRVPTGVLSGHVRDSSGNPVSLAAVHVEELNLTELTDAEGAYTFPTLAVGSYSVSVFRMGYSHYVVSPVVIADGQTTAEDFAILFMGIYPFPSSDVPRTILDFDTVTSVLMVDTAMPIGDLDVQISLTHSYDGDLRIGLQAPDGQIVLLTNREGGSGNDYTNTVFDDHADQPISAGSPPFTGTFRPEEPLALFDGMNVQGQWILIVGDLAAGDTGVVTAWEIEVTPSPENTGPTISLPAQQFALLGNYPNPFNSVTEIRYSLPRTVPLDLALYNILGQEVRTLIDGNVEAGIRVIRWDGCDNRGIPLASGLYLAHMRSAAQTSTAKLFLMR